MATDWRLPFATGREQFHHVFQKGIFSDVNLLIDGVDMSAVDKQVIQSHSLVLKIRSPVFEKLLEKVPPGSGGVKELSIQGFEAPQVKKFIQFLYTEELDSNSPHELQKILHLAKKYKVHGLVDRCTSALMTLLSGQSAASTFQVARDHNEIELEGKALQFILNNATEVVEDPDFASLNQINFCEILNKDEMDIDEIRLFLGVLQWARVECTRYKIQDTPKHLRLVLKEALNLIRFPVMTKEDFLEKVVPIGVLNDREVSEINRYFAASQENRQFAVPAMFSCKPRIGMVEGDCLDLTKTDEASHKRIAKFALKKARKSTTSDPLTSTTTLSQSLRVSSVIVEIELEESTSPSKLQDDIFKIKKYGLFWGGGMTIVAKEDKRLLVSFAAAENRSYGVGSVIEEIQDRFQTQIKTVLVKSFKEDITVHL